MVEEIKYAQLRAYASEIGDVEEINAEDEPEEDEDEEDDVEDDEEDAEDEGDDWQN